MNSVLNFHEVHSSDWFDKLICFLKSRYEMVSMDDIREYFNGAIGLENSCHITIDDGQRSFYDTIFPVLKKYKVPATLYVSPKVIAERSNYWFQEIRNYDKNELQKSISRVSVYPLKKIKMFDPLWVLKTLNISTIFAVIKDYQLSTGTLPKFSMNMTMEQLKEIDRSGLVTIGAHTMNHPILYNEDYTSCEYEISESITMLSNILNKKINYFAYPNGRYEMDFTEREENILSKNGIELAVTTMAGNLSTTTSATRVPRLGIADGSPLIITRAKISLGSYWGRIRNIVVAREFKQRNSVYKSLDEKV